MAHLIAHGGQCCGMRHIHNFRDDDAENVRELRRHTTSVANGNFNLEVILSNRQATSYPLLIAELARLGYVYTTAFSGQHGTPVHVFHRAAKRLALARGMEAFRWQGMTAGVGLGGNLPVMAGAGEAPVAIPADLRPFNHVLPVRRGEIQAGSRVRVNSPQSTRNGREFVVERVGLRPDIASMRDGDRTFNIVLDNLVLLNDDADAAPAPGPEGIDIPRTMGNLGLPRFGARFRRPQDGVIFIHIATPEYIRAGSETPGMVGTFIREDTGEFQGNAYFHNLRFATTPIPANPGWQARQRRNDEEPADLPVFRHPQLDNGGPAAAVVPPAPPAPNADPILNEVFALFADGRVRGPFGYVREVQAAYPRVRRYQRRRVFADGRIVTEDAAMPR